MKKNKLCGACLSKGLNPCLPHCRQILYHEKEPTSNEGDPGSIPGLGKSPGGGNGNPLQYSCLGNPRTEDPGRLQSVEVQRVENNRATKASLLSTI